MGVVLTFTRFVPDGAGMSKAATEWWYGRSVSCAVPLSLKAGLIPRTYRTKVGGGDIELRVGGEEFLGPHQTRSDSSSSMRLKNACVDLVTARLGPVSLFRPSMLMSS